MFHCRAGATSTRQKERHTATMMAQTLTVPLEPSFVPFGFFCMTAVADLESLMSAIPSGEGGYGIGGPGSGCGALGRRIWDGVSFYIPSEHGTREAGVRL
jgi:hypothetical protein